MHYKAIRGFNLPIHRYLGLWIGMVLAMVGLTGSILVFQPELEQASITWQHGVIVPQDHRLALAEVLSRLKAHYISEAPISILSIDFSRVPNLPDLVKIKNPVHESIEVLVNPYTGEILGDRRENNLSFKWIHKLHDHLLIGKIYNIDLGKIIVGVTAFLFLTINLTGTVLWDGWRKLKQGFSIQWQAKPRRIHYDIHKVVGIFAVVFLSLTAFTGFLWSFKLAKPIAHFVTFSHTDMLERLPTSIGSLNWDTLNIADILQKADAALPGAPTTRIKFPEKPGDSLKIHKKFPQERSKMGHSRVTIEPVTGNVLEVKNGLYLPLYQRVLLWFEAIHDGTFAGLPTRILYGVVGTTPLILFVTSLGMYIYRRPKVKKITLIH
jgi:uncharacterized iron-regulated membrane protein